MRRITDTSGTVHFIGIPERHVTLCGSSTATKDLLGNMIDRATETISPCTCRECATLYAAIKNAPWNEVQDDALDFGMFAAIDGTEEHQQLVNLPTDGNQEGGD